MKKLLFFLASAALLAAGCQEEVTNPSEQNGGLGFNASTESFAVISKTSMDADRNILWSEGDQIAIFMDSPTASLFEVTHETAGTSQGKFTLVGTQNGKADSDRNVAVYPYQEALECASNGVHDEEDTKITIQPHRTQWNNKMYGMNNLHR